jgi:mRNA interferase MazF
LTVEFVFGDVVLVPFPFTDQSGTKKRPAVVVSTDAYNAGRPDLVIMAITSQLRLPPGLGEAAVLDWRACGLLKPSLFKPVFATIERRLILRGMGRLAPEDLDNLRALIAQCLG